MAFASGISHRGLADEVSHIPFFLAAGIVEADLGKPVSIDTSAFRTVKIALDGEVIVGFLQSWENRVVEGYLIGTVALRGGHACIRTAAGTAIAAGDPLCGGGGGEVRKAIAADASVVKTHLLTATFASGVTLEAIFR